MGSGASWGSSRRSKCARAPRSQTSHPQSQEDYLFGVQLVTLLVLSPLLTPSARARPLGKPERPNRQKLNIAFRQVKLSMDSSWEAR